MREASWTGHAKAALGAALMATLCGCGPDLGECNPTVLGGSDGTVTPPRPHDGQVIVNNSCANGRCHSATAEGALRVGAPAELDFDVVPLAATTVEQASAETAKVRNGAAVVYDWREAMWGEIEDGHMPPPRPAGSGELNAMQKETVRNWLACGAEVIVTPQVIETTADWTSIYDALSGMGCGTCHGGAAAAGDGFMFGDAGDKCGSYARVVNAAAITDIGVPPCAGTGQLVVPMNPDASILLQKLAGTPTCGAPMPLGSGMGLGPTNPIVQDLREWIMAGAPKPTDCP